MKSKIQLEINESDVLKSIASQSKDETFDFVDKILNHYEYPSEIAGELINHLEGYIDSYQRSEYQHEIQSYVDGSGNLTGKYKPKEKRVQLDKKPRKLDFSKDKPSYCLK